MVCRGIALLTIAPSLQADVLCSVLAQHLSVPGKVLTSIPDAADVGLKDHLLLIDCQGQSFDQLRALLASAHKLGVFSTVALINAIANSDHEKLLEWPCISGVFFSDTDQAQLFRGLERLLDGEYWVPRRLLHHFLAQNRRTPSANNVDIKLTKRERQILQLIKEGATNSHIAEDLALSQHTVKSHLYNVYKKIGVRNRLEASHWVHEMDEL